MITRGEGGGAALAETISDTVAANNGALKPENESVVHIEVSSSTRGVDELTASLSGKPTMQRFKGLGEMMPQELWTTTMDPSKRMLKKVTIQDAAEADRLLSVLMGNAIAPRKAFISEHAETLDWSALDL